MIEYVFFILVSLWKNNINVLTLSSQHLPLEVAAKFSSLPKYYNFTLLYRTLNHFIWVNLTHFIVTSIAFSS